MNKGDFLYLDKKKKKQLIIAILSMLMVVIICVTGIIMYNTRKSVFAVIAALASLPAAKMLVGYLVLMPYKSVSVKTKQIIEENAGDLKYCEIIYDVLLASEQKASYAGVIFIKDGKVFSYTDHYENKKKPNTEEYIKNIIKDSCNYQVIKSFDNIDNFKKAIAVESTSHLTHTKDEQTRMLTTNKKISDRIKIFMM